MFRTKAARGALLVAGLVLICLILSAWWFDAHNDRFKNEVRYQPYIVTPTTVKDWMTFDYLNQVFKLPPDYLQDALNIQDTQYPDISIRQYAEARNLDTTNFLMEVQTTLAAYATTSTP